MKTMTIRCPAADRPVLVVWKPTSGRGSPVPQCVAPCTGRYCPGGLKSKAS